MPFNSPQPDSFHVGIREAPEDPATVLLHTALGDPVLDSQWQLVQRIIISRDFVRSPRLSSFLICVCDLAREGALERINEHYIGTTVFNRRADYDPAIDSIVRSHASRLRQQLAKYFSDPGCQEEWILTIPKGSYIPVFHRRSAEVPQEHKTERSVETAHGVATNGPPEAEALTYRGSHSVSSSTSQTLLRLVSVALAMVTALCCSLAVWAIRDQHRATEHAAAPNDIEQVLWAKLFNVRSQTVVVTADSGLVMLQQLTKQRVSLPTYMDGSYLTAFVAGKPYPKELLDLGTRRYTTTVDLMILNKILRSPEIDARNTRLTYSRDLMPSDIKQKNLVLLGTYESTPWVQLFEPGMNFYCQDDLARGVFSTVNRHPLPGEQASYTSSLTDPQKTVYGVVAYRPSLDGAGKVLILEGHTMAGTEAASDFVFDDEYFRPFLKSILRADGSIPYFESLVRSTSLHGQSARIELVAERTEDR